MNDIRDNIKKLIEDKGVTQVRIAHKIGLTPAQLSGILHKKRKLEANELFAICLVLGITPDALKSYPMEEKVTL